MDCQEFEAHLERYLDERLNPGSPELRLHADHCVTCQERLQEAVVLWHGVAAWRKALPEPSNGLADRIVEHLRATRKQDQPGSKRDVSIHPVASAADGRQSSPSRWQAWMVAAGAVAAMWLVFLGSNFHETGRPDRRLTAIGRSNSGPQPTSATEKLQVTPPADLETVLVSAEGAYSQLADKTLEAAQDFALLWPASQAVSRAATPTVAPQNPETNWNQSWPRELAPIGDSVGDALDFLWRAAPRVEKSST